MTKTGELRREEVCADAIGRDGETVYMRHCHGHHGNQQWTHDKVMTFFYMILGWLRGVAVTCFSSDQQSYYTPGPVSTTVMGK